MSVEKTGLMIATAVTALALAGCSSGSSETGATEGDVPVSECVIGAWSGNLDQVANGPVESDGHSTWTFDTDSLTIDTDSVISYHVPAGQDGEGSYKVEQKGTSKQAYEVEGEALTVGAVESVSGTVVVTPVDDEGAPTGDAPTTVDYEALVEGSSFTVHCAETTLTLEAAQVDGVPDRLQPHMDFTKVN